MESKQIVLLILFALPALLTFSQPAAQHNTIAGYRYLTKYVEGKPQPDSCLYSVDYFNEDSILIKTESFGPCNSNPFVITYLLSDSLLIGEIRQYATRSIAYRYLYIEGQLSTKIANDYYPGEPAFITFIYDESGRVKEERRSDILHKPLDNLALIKYSYTKTGIHRVSFNGNEEVILIEDIVTDAKGREREVFFRNAGDKSPFMAHRMTN